MTLTLPESLARYIQRYAAENSVTSEDAFAMLVMTGFVLLSDNAALWQLVDLQQRINHCTVRTAVLSAVKDVTAALSR